MRLMWNEIRDRAVAFSHDWAGETSEKGEAKTFWDAFFRVFGIERRMFALFENRVKNIRGEYDYIDLFWPHTLLAEHKSRGEDLTKAGSQAFNYIQELIDDGRRDELPRYVVLSDFARFVLYDLEGKTPDTPIEFPLSQLAANVRAFGFMIGQGPVVLDPEAPANFKATQIMGALHKTLKAGGFGGHELEQFLVRVLFCLFSEDNQTFEPMSFTRFIEEKTRDDGSDLGAQLARLFQVLDTPTEMRQKNLDEDLSQFPYVNGALFRERLTFADFNSSMREALLNCTRFNWSRISPAVFGSLFQTIMGADERRHIGGHYTSERDIMKVVRALFLDELWAELDCIQTNRAELRRFHDRLAQLRFFDPACGCGNFLILAYREVRLVETEVIRRLNPTGQQVLDVRQLSKVDVDQCYGIEILEWPARIAEVALWLMDHQMNQRLSEVFGQAYARLPLVKAPNIVVGNALQVDWKKILPPGEGVYVLSNPPFVGKHYQTPEQRADMGHVFGSFKNTGDLDYVVCWHHRAAEYIQGTGIKVGFVSTNSITQGEQVPLVWGILFGQYHVKIHFAYRTFQWQSEASGKAHVHVVIIGFAAFDIPTKRLYDADPDGSGATVSKVPNISPYLTPGLDAFVVKRRTPLSPIPEMRCGNKPSDGGQLILTDSERADLLAAEPGAAHFLRRFTGSEEFINGNMRWCLWLEDAEPGVLRSLPLVMERVEKVREFRLKSTAAPTRAAALTPALFFYRSQPTQEYILIPEVSSERRDYIPIGIMPPDVISANTNFLVPSSDRFLLGVLTSAMHMAWVRQIGGRLKSDYRYSGSMVYNTFPWPDAPTAKQRAAVAAEAQSVLDTRAKYTISTLADLYDPRSMPADLVKAHASLDRAVDRCYRAQPFTSDRQRVEFLFVLYGSLAAPLLPSQKSERRKRSPKVADLHQGGDNPGSVA